MNNIKMYVFDVGAGQCIFIGNPANPYDSTLIDCGFKAPSNRNERTPLGFLIEKGLLGVNQNGYILGNLIITNYDFDHFKGIKYLTDNINIGRILCSNNITTEQLKHDKGDQGFNNPIFERLYDVKNHSTSDEIIRTTSFNIYTICASVNELKGNRDTNNLSLMTIVSVFDSIIIIPGDLETEGRNALLGEMWVKQAIKKADIYVASHHGRDNGLPEGISNLLSENTDLKCVVISDKGIEYDTQDGMTALYNSFVQTGIPYNRFNRSRITWNGRNTVTSYPSDTRKVLTTRNDGNFVITISDNGDVVAEEFYM